MALTSEDFDLIADDDADAIFRNTKVTRARWRRQGFGPKFIKIGRRIFYRRSTLDDWVRSNQVSSAAEQRMISSDRKASRSA